MRFGETGKRSWTDYWQSPNKVSERGDWVGVEVGVTKRGLIRFTNTCFVALLIP